MIKDLFSIPIKREIPFNSADRSEFIAVMMESGYILYLSPDKSNLTFVRKIQFNANGSELSYKKLNPLNRIRAALQPGKLILRVHCIKIILFMIFINALVTMLLYLAGMSVKAIWFLAFFFLAIELLMVLFNVYINLESILSKISSTIASKHSR